MKVSVLMVTYNHEAFIAQAIESVLMQKVAFEYELLIGEDCSTDKTREIVESYAQKHPNIIRLVLQKQNVGAARNHIATHAACRGEYIANLDGDDFWTSPLKLQTQVDLLDAHPEWAMCFHPALFFEQDGSRESRVYPNDNRTTPWRIEELFEANVIPSCSLMVRNSIIHFPEWFPALKVGDWAFHILNAQHGEIGYVPEVMGSYRIHGKGAWSINNDIWRARQLIEMFEAVAPAVKSSQRPAIFKKLFRLHSELAWKYLEAGDLPNAQTSAMRAFRAQPFSSQVRTKSYLSLLLRAYAPGLARRVFRDSTPSAKCG